MASTSVPLDVSNNFNSAGAIYTELTAVLKARSGASSTALVPANPVTTMVAQALPSVTPTSTALVTTNQETRLVPQRTVQTVTINPVDIKTAALGGQFVYFKFIKNESYPLKEDQGKLVPDHDKATSLQKAQLKFFENVRTIIKANNPVGLQVYFDQLTSSIEGIQTILESSANSDVRDSVANLIIITKQITDNVLKAAKDSSQTTIGVSTLSQFLEETDFDKQIQVIEESTQAEPAPVESPAAPAATKANKTGGINLLKTLLWVGGLVALFLSRDAIASAGQNLLNGALVANPSINGVQNFVGHSGNIVPTLNNEFVNSSFTSTNFILVENPFTPSRIPTAFVSTTEEEDFEQPKTQTEEEVTSLVLRERAAAIREEQQTPAVVPALNPLSHDEPDTIDLDAQIQPSFTLDLEERISSGTPVDEETNGASLQDVLFNSNVQSEQTFAFEEQEETSWFGTAAKIVALPVVALGILLNRG